MGLPRVSTYRTMARLKSGDGTIGEVGHAADIKVGIAGRRGASTAFAPEAESPALLRKGGSRGTGRSIGVYTGRVRYLELLG